MTDRARRLLQDALEMTSNERADLASELLATLEPSDPPDEVAAAWDAEIEERERQALADPDGGTPWVTLRDEIKASLKR